MNASFARSMRAGVKMLKKTYERLLMLSMVVSASVGCDQITKRIAEHSLENKSYSFLFDTLRLHHIKNTGAFLGAGANYNSSLKFILFIIL